MAHDARLGLATLPSAAGVTPSYLDAQQWVKGGLAVRRWLAERLGGEGIHHGGATVVGDLSSGGTKYPAVRLVIYDDGGETWFFTTASATTISFTATSGAGALYAVVSQMVGVSPVAATGGRTEVSFVAQLDADPAPAHSLKLGTGTITASAFTTWTETASIRARTFRVGDGTDANLTMLFDDGTANPPGLRWNTTSNQVEVSHNGTTWTALAAAGFVTGPASATADNLVAFDATTGKLVKDAGVGAAALARRAATPTNGHVASVSAAGDVVDAGYAATDVARLSVDNTLTGVLVLTNGKLRSVRNAGFGPPVAAGGAHTEGDRWWDAAGSHWYCTASGTPGTWVQVAPGTASTWSGGGATDITADANWLAGAKVDGYRVHEPGVLEWTYNASVGTGRWVGSPREQAASPGRGMPSNWSITATADPCFVACLDPAYDHLLTGLSLSYYTSGTYSPGTIEWVVVAYPFGGAPAATITISAQSPGGTTGSQTASVLTTATQVFIKATPTGAPPALNPWGCGVSFRPVRK